MAGSYDNEGIAIFALMFTYFLWVRWIESVMLVGSCLALLVLCSYLGFGWDRRLVMFFKWTDGRVLDFVFSL